MKIFDIDYLDIPFVDFPPKGESIVCLDPQKRLGEKTWAVLRSTGPQGGVSNAMGLFWDKDAAIAFAQNEILFRKHND